MKKLIIRLLIAFVVVIILAVLALRLFLDAGIKRAVETIGPKLTKVDIKLKSVNVSLLSGSGSIKDLVVGNPEGFKEPFAISVGSASLSLKPSSLLSDKIVIKSIKVEAPEITYETTLKTSNLGKILSNVQEATGGGQKEPAKPQEPAQTKEAKPAKKLQVDEFIITGGKVLGSLTGVGSITAPLPDIHLTDLGTGPEGITAGELAERVLAAIQAGAAQAASGAAADLGKTATSAAAGAVGAGSNAVESITKGIGGLFKKK
jgi:hypothetical protein